MRADKNRNMPLKHKIGMNNLIAQLRTLITSARQQAIRAVDAVQVRTYWEIGRHIVEFEQKGAQRAEYGAQLLDRLADKLTVEFGKGFDTRNLRNMRAFYMEFPKWYAVRTELSWTHYRLCYAQHNRYYVGLALMLASLPPLTALFSFYTT